MPSAPRAEMTWAQPAMTYTYVYPGWNVPGYYSLPASAWAVPAAPYASPTSFVPVRPFAAPATTTASSPHPPAEGPCDKCDGPHLTGNCPHFEKPRERHPDAWRLKGKSRLVASEELEEAKFLRQARVVRQPGDGSCLFHSVAFGLADGSTAASLRKQVADVICKHPGMRILDTALSEWIRMDASVGVRAYVEDLLSGAWGGGIELAVLAQMKKVRFEIYEARQGGYARIARFGSCGRVVALLFQGRQHYDALVI